MKKSIAIVAVLMMVIGTLQAQKPLIDYRMWSKPEVLWMPPANRGQVFYLRNEEPCTLNVVTKVGNDMPDFFRYEVSFMEGTGSIEPVPGQVNTFVVTPKLADGEYRVRLGFYCTTPGYRLLWPVAKPGKENHLYGQHDHIAVRESIAGWEPADHSPHKRMLLDTPLMRVLQQGK